MDSGSGGEGRRRGPQGFGANDFGGGRRPQLPNIQIPKGVAAFGGCLVFLVLVLGAMWVTGRLGLGKIRADQVAVVVNYMSGEKKIVDQPGIKIYLPFVEEIFLLDKSSQEFLMEGNNFVDANHVPQLTVRANDGSNFFFEKISILYELDPDRADVVLTDSGPGDRFKNNWVKAHARSVLRDEFGRFSAVEAADPTQYEAAATRSKERLNELLLEHGLIITQIVTPKPRFDPDYERAIEERKESDQEVERLIAKVEQLEQERGQRLSAVEKDKLIEKQGLQGDLIRAKRDAEAEAIKLKLSADGYALKRRRSGEAEKEEKVAEARGLESKYTNEAEGLKRQAEALEKRGEVVVREALIEKLSQIVFSFVPYSRDPSPKRLEHNDLRGADGRSLEQKSAEEVGGER